MAKRGRRHEDDFEDDGRVIADMSGVERPSLFGVRAPERSGGGRGAGGHLNGGGRFGAASHGDAAGRDDAARRDAARHGPEVKLTPKERLWMILGALRAGLTISLVYIVVIGVILLALIGIWSALS